MNYDSGEYAEDLVARLVSHLDNKYAELLSYTVKIQNYLEKATDSNLRKDEALLDLNEALERVDAVEEVADRTYLSLDYILQKAYTADTVEVPELLTTSTTPARDYLIVEAVNHPNKTTESVKYAADKCVGKDLPVPDESFKDALYTLFLNA